jgi:hypothetical protein
LIQRMAQARYDHPANKRWVTKADFSLGGMDVHIY